MKLSNFVLGLDMLRQHFSDPDGYHLAADHDIFYVYATDTPLNSEEYKFLKDLGWFQPESSKEYSPREGWAAYV